MMQGWWCEMRKVINAMMGVSDARLAIRGATTMPVDLICLTPQERTIYQALVDAAENSLVCPNYLDLNELVGYESASASVGVVKRLEAKGLIVVSRYQRFRLG